MKHCKKALCLLMSLILISEVCVFKTTSLSKYGSTGSEVKSIQKVLKNQGYYNGAIDGIYGSATKKAVQNYQRDYGLTVDGIAGSKTLKSMGISQSSSQSGQYSDSEISLLARIISAESRGEPYAGQVAVGAVILNRVEHPSFPNTIAGVVYQKGAFSCVTDGQINEPVKDSARKAALDAMNGWDPSGGAIYYYNPAKATSKWIFSREVIVVIVKHRFCL